MRAEQRADKLCLDSHVSITTLVQPLPSWFPLSTVPQPPAAWRTPDARGRRCRPSPPRRSGQACEDKTPKRVVPSTFPRHRWSRLLLPFPLPASLPTAVSMCARRNPALCAHVPCSANRSILPCRVCGSAGAVCHYARCHVQPPSSRSSKSGKSAALCALHAQLTLPLLAALRWHSCLAARTHVPTPSLRSRARLRSAKPSAAPTLSHPVRGTTSMGIKGPPTSCHRTPPAIFL
jgi:hypothetical protein